MGFSVPPRRLHLRLLTVSRFAGLWPLRSWRTTTQGRRGKSSKMPKLNFYVAHPTVAYVLHTTGDHAKVGDIRWRGLGSVFARVFQAG
jgi:hypothetical protein